MTADEIYTKISALDDSLRFKLLTNHHRPKQFPSTYQDGCYRSFSADYFSDRHGNDRPWLVYSSHLDGAFCVQCVLFCDYAKRQQLKALVNAPFKRWSRYSNTIGIHDAKGYHIDAVAQAKAFINTVKHPASKVTNMLDQRKLSNISSNRALLSHLIKAIVYLTKQGLALRGHDETTASNNRGNYLELLYLMSQYSPVIKAHLEKHEKKSNATYLSPQSQNELIDVIGKECIRANIVEDIQKARFFSILCDESSSTRTEYMSLVIRYVSLKDNSIREEFLGFHPVTKCTGQILGTHILDRIASLGLDISCCRGQGYDGAAAMSSDRCGVQAAVKEAEPKAAYLHCASHCLNLVISHSCKLPTIRNVNDKISAVNTLFY